MMSLEPKKYFLELLKEAQIQDNILFNGDVRPVLELVLQHVLKHLELRDFFASYFIEIVYSVEDSIYGTPEVTEYCMHALRWSEVKEALEERNRHAKTSQERFFVEGVLDCFNDDWHHADSYLRFNKNSND